MRPNARAVFGRSGPLGSVNVRKYKPRRGYSRLNVGTQRASWVDTIHSLTVRCHQDNLCLHSAFLLR